MNLSARELGLIAAAKRKSQMLAKAREMRAALNLPPAPVLDTLILTSAERIN